MLVENSYLCNGFIGNGERGDEGWRGGRGPFFVMFPTRLSYLCVPCGFVEVKSYRR